ncbi:hypothetical protein ACFLSX_01950 [Calditrichota bacterium]
MFDLGIATSVAKKQNYSWQKTTEIAKSLSLKAIQFYLPQNGKIPIVDVSSYFNNIYLHLPNTYHLQIKQNLLAAEEFYDIYSSKKIIVHQNENLSNKENLETISNFAQKGFKVGIENEAKTNLYSYIELIKYLYQNNMNIFSVIDFHRFYCNFHKQFNPELIFDMILRLFDLCVVNKIDTVIHLIDSNSFSSERKYWTPILNGILPYTEIFSYIIKSIILEYETEELIGKSISNFKKSLLFFERN